MTEREHPYFITHSGQRIDLTDLREGRINLDDVAHGLSKICRYGSSLPLNIHYSVAQHSMHLAKAAKDLGWGVETQRACLAHDFSEYLLGDVVNGLKQLLPDYKKLEAEVTSLINKKYDIKINGEIEWVVKCLDTRILLNESEALMPAYYDHFKQQLTGWEPLDCVSIVNEFEQRDWEETKIKFLSLCDQLGIKD